VTARSRPLEWWIAVIRLGTVIFAVLQVSLTTGYTPGTRTAAWALTGALAAGGIVLFVGASSPAVARTWFRVASLAFDVAIVSGFVLLFAYEPGTPTRQLLLIVVVEGAIAFGLWGGLAVAVVTIPIALWFEQRRSALAHVRFRPDYVTFQGGAGIIMALIVGWLVSRLDAERRGAEQGAAAAEALRDELGRRADLLDAANRCARALSSSLDREEAFGAFIRELRGLVPFRRIAIVLLDEGEAHVIATAGEAAEDVMPPGTRLGLQDNLLREVVDRAQTVVRGDMVEERYVEEAQLLALGIRCRVVAPLLVGARAIGVISVGRAVPDAFTEPEIELVTLLGRLVGAAVQNMRAFEAERHTVEELRRLSALRADFVSLVSHELRSPMAAVIGAARTLRARWRELVPDQREAFLALIADETSRLAAMIGDVLDTSRIDAGTFTYRFDDVDVAAVVNESVASSELGQDEVPVVAQVALGLPAVRGDRERLRQVVGNLIENAVKYSPAGSPVEVRARAVDSVLLVSVSDRGPGIAPVDQRLIFEKFGRVTGSQQKPGSGLGLYIARSIAEAHGGSLDVESRPGHGATFTLALPVGRGGRRAGG
jgi:signal transduction histidine kinase